MPVYNEKATIATILEQVAATPFDKQIIIVDDCSTDGTRELLQDELIPKYPEAMLLLHERNQGKGMAIRTGLAAVTGDYVLIQDADLEYDPADYERLMAPIQAGKAQVVYGSRFIGEHRNMFFHHWVGNWLLTLITNVLYNTTLSDMETCYKVWPAPLIKALPLRANRFDFEPEVTAKVLKRGVRIYEVPVSYAGREYHEGKKITWRDGISALWSLIIYRFID